MKKQFLLILLSLAFQINIHAQGIVWAQSAGNTKSDKCTAIRTDSLGYIYAAGYFGNTISLGTNNLNLQNTYNADSKEVWLAKFDSLGACLWAISGGEYFDDRILGLAVDSAGNSVVTGTFWQTSTGFNFNGTSVAVGGGNGSADQAFVSKVDPNGNVLWIKLIRSDQGDDQGMDVAIDKNGFIYTCGFMVGNDLYGGGTLLATDTSSGSREQPYWLTKQDPAGNFLWGKTFGNLPFDSVVNKYIERDIACAVDENGNIYVTGGFDHTRNFSGISLTSLGSYDGFLISYNPSGAVRFAKKFGSTNKDWCNGICSDKNGSIYVTGEHRDSLYYDGQFMARNYDGRDVFVIKTDAGSGLPLWGARAGRDEGSERGNDIVADKNCNVYVTGDINLNAKFGDNIELTQLVDKQSFVAKIDPDGKWRWAFTGGGVGDDDRANAIALGLKGQIYAGGFMRSAATFGSTILPYIGSSDIWLARLNDSVFNKSYGFDLRKPELLEFCQGGATTMDIPTNDYFDYNPKTGTSFDAGTQQITFAPLVTTTYTVTGYTGSVCRDEDTVIFTVIVHPYSVADFDLTPAVVPIENATFNLIGKSQNAVAYKWYYRNAEVGNSVDLTYTPTELGEHCFTLVALGTFNCNDTITYCGEVVKIEKAAVFFPNAFSPNGDTKNDEFKPLILNFNDDPLSDYSFKVMNRWGQIVFETNDPFKGWDGKFGQEEVPIGTYFYMARYKDAKGKEFNHRGDISLLR